MSFLRASGFVQPIAQPDRIIAAWFYSTSWGGWLVPPLGQSFLFSSFFRRIDVHKGEEWRSGKNSFFVLSDESFFNFIVRG